MCPGLSKVELDNSVLCSCSQTKLNYTCEVMVRRYVPYPGKRRPSLLESACWALTNTRLAWAQQQVRVLLGFGQQKVRVSDNYALLR